MNQTQLINKMNSCKKHSIYIKIGKKIYRIFPLQIAPDGILQINSTGKFAKVYRYNEYGKKWALTIEELLK